MEVRVVDETALVTQKGAQSLFWRKFYEDAWAARADFIRARIRDAETNPYRIINQLSAHERRYKIIPEGDGVEYVRHVRAPDTPITPAGVPAVRQTSFRG